MIDQAAAGQDDQSSYQAHPMRPPVGGMLWWPTVLPERYSRSRKPALGACSVAVQTAGGGFTVTGRANDAPGTNVSLNLFNEGSHLIRVSYGDYRSGRDPGSASR